MYNESWIQDVADYLKEALEFLGDDDVIRAERCLERANDILEVNIEDEGGLLPSLDFEEEEGGIYE